MQKITRIAALLLVVVAVVLALVAINLGRRASRAPAVAAAPTPAMGTGRSAPGMRASQSQTVVTAVSDLAAGQPITANALRLASVRNPPPGNYDAVDKVAGSVPRVDIPAGTTITPDLLADGLALKLRPGERALAVPVDEATGAGNRIEPGDYVDVFLSLKPVQDGGLREAAKERDSQTRLLLSRLRVLAYGSRDLPAPPTSSTAAADTGKPPRTAAAQNPPSPRTAVLAVPVDEVDALLLGMQNGRLALALRHPSDEGRPDSALFPPPRTALTPLAGLSETRRAALAEPDNRAFAGIGGAGLAGEGAPTKPAPRIHAGNTGGGLEIIRGTASGGLHSPRSPTP